MCAANVVKIDNRRTSQVTWCRPKPLRAMALLVLCLGANHASAQLGGQFGGQFGGRWGGGGGADVELLDQFDLDHNGVLNKSERQAAYQAMGGELDERTAAASKPVNVLIKPAQVRTYPDKPLYDLSVLRTVFINFEDANWEAQMATFKGTDIDVPATVQVDGKTYKGVGVHFRGNTSFMSVPDGYKRSLKLSFDMIDTQQRLMGYRALELMNVAADASYVRAPLYLQISREYFPAPKANFVRVVINGESWGVYVNSQPFNSDFVKEVTGSDKGARWKVRGSPGARGGMEYFGENPETYKGLYEISSKDKPESWTALIHLFKVLNQTPADKLDAALKPLLDVDQVLRFLAVDNALINNDGYWVRGSDYSIYQDASGMFHITAHDVNEAMRDIERMGRGMRNRGSNTLSATGVALDPLISVQDSSKPLLSKLLAVPDYKRRYLQYVRDIATRWLDWSRIGPLAVQYQALIAEDVKHDERKLYSYEAFVDGLTKDGTQEGFGMLSTSEISLKTFVETRRRYLLDYFAKGGASSAGSSPAGTVAAPKRTGV